MKFPTYAIAALAAILTTSCNKQKAAINESTEATKDAIDSRKAEVDASAKYATEQTDANAKIELLSRIAVAQVIPAAIDTTS